MTSFQDFGLADPISRALKEENYHTPTPIQAQTSPLARTGRDVGGRSSYETSRPGVFAVGDVRAGSVKRVASSVGEGSVVVSAIWSHVNASHQT